MPCDTEPKGCLVLPIASAMTMYVIRGQLASHPGGHQDAKALLPLGQQPEGVLIRPAHSAECLQCAMLCQAADVGSVQQ
jgi:hypothetical protein